MNVVTINSIKFPVWIAKSTQFDGLACTNGKTIPIENLQHDFIVYDCRCVSVCVCGCGGGWKYSTKQVFRGRVNFTQWTFSMYEHFTPHKHKENLMPSDDNGDLLTAPLLLQLPPISESISHIGCTSFEFQCQTFCHFATHKCVRCIQRITHKSALVFMLSTGTFRINGGKN